MIYLYSLNIDNTFGRSNTLEIYPLDGYVPIVFCIYRRRVIRTSSAGWGWGNERERERRRKECWRGIEKQVGYPEMPSDNYHEKALPQGSFLPFSSLYPRFVLAQKVGLAFLQKIQQGSPNLGPPANLYCSSSVSPIYRVNTPKDKVKEIMGCS